MTCVSHACCKKVMSSRQWVLVERVLSSNSILDAIDDHMEQMGVPMGDGEQSRIEFYALADIIAESQPYELLFNYVMSNVSNEFLRQIGVIYASDVPHDLIYSVVRLFLSRWPGLEMFNEPSDWKYIKEGMLAPFLAWLQRGRGRS